MSELRGETRWKELLSRLEESDRFVLTTHVNPDGDGLGAEIALHHFLSGRGKDARIINPAPIPQVYRFLDAGGAVEIFDAERFGVEFFRDKTVVSLDNSSFNRMGRLGSVLAEADCGYICLDHHPFEGGLSGFHYIDESASATGELVYRLIADMGGKMDRVVAEAIYVAVLTDTGGFRFPNTTIEALRIAADLVAAGVSPARIYDKIYEMNRPHKLRLLGLALKDLEVHHDGRTALLLVTRSMMERTGAERFEVDGFVEELRTIEGIELGALLLELPGGEVKASLRSKWDVNVQKLAAAFGGGGHPRAAGFVAAGSLEQIKGSLLDKAEELLVGPGAGFIENNSDGNRTNC